ncbi:putative FAD-linked oxidoreductase [Talaromyces pinophilus]|nr:putative FAD-linked oxidoreductase [Talaromyces pinophilus]
MTCAALTALMGQQNVALSDNSSYAAALSSYASQQEASLQPTCIIFPQTSSDVSAAVVALQNQDQRTPFAIRSGGHTYWAGAANIADGVVVDLTGVGASWGTLYSLLDPLGLSVNGGRVAGVGVGGLSLGGGISFFSPRYGWTCDTVTNYQIVLANGSIVDANSQSNPDLFQALKGGNNNFGIATYIEFSTFPQGNLWAASVSNDLSLADDVIAQFVNLNSPTAYDEYASFVMSFGYTQAQDSMVITSDLDYTQVTQSVENPPAVYEAWLALPNLTSTSQIINMSSLSVADQSIQPDGARSLSLVTTLLSNTSVIKAASEAWQANVPSITNVPNISFALTFEPLPPSFYSRGARTNSLGLANRNESLAIAVITANWFTSTDDTLVNTTMQSLLDNVNSAATELGGSDSYGNQSVALLQEVRRRVDPSLVFTEQVPGGYKIPS